MATKKTSVKKTTQTKPTVNDVKKVVVVDARDEEIAQLKKELRAKKGQFTKVTKSLGAELSSMKNRYESSVKRAWNIRTKMNNAVDNGVALHQKYKRATTVNVIAFALVSVLGASTVLTSLGWINEADLAKAREQELQNQIVVVQTEKDNIYTQMIEKDRQVRELVNQTIVGFNVKESQIFADQEIPEGRYPEKVTGFGPEYDINLSVAGKANYLNGKDDVITIDTFATVNDAIIFINGYANGYLMAKVDSLTDRVDELTQILDQVQAGDNSQLIAQLIQEKQDLQDELARTKTEAEQTQKVLEEQIGALQQENERLNAELVTVVDRLNQVVAEKDALVQERDALVQERDAIQQQYEERDAEYNVLSDLYEQALKRENMSNIQLNEISNKLAIVKEERDQLGKKLEQKEAELEAKDAEIGRKDDAYATLEGRFYVVEAERNAANNKIDELMDTNEALTEDLEYTQDKLAEANEKIDRLEKAQAGDYAQQETPSTNKPSQGNTNAPVADNNNPDDYQPEDNNNKDNDVNQPSNGR